MWRRKKEEKIEKERADEKKKGQGKNKIKDKKLRNATTIFLQ